MVSRNEVSVALKRIRAVVLRRALPERPRLRRTARLRAEQAQRTPPVDFRYPQATSTQARNIRLGLDRIIRVAPTQQTWKGVHVAGTNGKGSICAFLTGLFKLSGYSFGTFTSPAFPERHNAVTVNGMYVNKRMFETELKQIEDKSKALLSRRYLFKDPSDYTEIGDLTPFEADTATAFHVFNKMHVQYGIVEVGMGGATDATNVMKHKSVAVISKIDLDHQEYLGDTLKKIARVKAGIMQPGVPCVVDYTNQPVVLREIRAHAHRLKCPIYLSNSAQQFIDEIDTSRFQLEEYQKQNLLCALRAFQSLFPEQPIDVNQLLALDPFMPGRLEKVGVEELTAGQRHEPVLVDGAHNMLGIEALATHVDGRLRVGDAPVTWVMAISAGPSKPFAEIIKKLVRPQDNVAFIKFQQGPTDPPPAPIQSGREIASGIVSTGIVYDGEPNITDAIQWASQIANGGPLVVTGSLYLVRDFFKLDGLKRTREIKTRNPGRSQLSRYVVLEQERNLAPEENREFKRARRYWYLSPSGITRHRYRQATGIKQWPPKVPKHVSELQKKADYHEQQADIYEWALKGIQKDSDRGLLSGREKNGSSSPLQAYAKEMQEQLEMHKTSFQAAAGELRKHSILRYKRASLPREALRRRRPGLRGRKNPHLARSILRKELLGSRKKAKPRESRQVEPKASTKATLETPKQTESEVSKRTTPKLTEQAVLETSAQEKRETSKQAAPEVSKTRPEASQKMMPRWSKKATESRSAAANASTTKHSGEVEEGQRPKVDSVRDNV